MMPFYELSFSLRAVFIIWAILLLCTGISGMLLSIVVKRYQQLKLPTPGSGANVADALFSG